LHGCQFLLLYYFMRRFWGVILGWCTVWSAHNLGSRNTGLLIKILMKLCVHMFSCVGRSLVIGESLFFLSHPWSPAECITRNRYCYTVKRSGLQNELSHSGRQKKTPSLPIHQTCSQEIYWLSCPISQIPQP
jgi:hypothetical protein